MTQKKFNSQIIWLKDFVSYVSSSIAPSGFSWEKIFCSGNFLNSIESNFVEEGWRN